MDQLNATELKARLEAGDIDLIDVRQPDEHAFAAIEGARLIPLGEIVSRMDELDASRETAIYCHTGGRSARAIQALQHYGFTGKLYNLAGGINAWSNDVDPTVPRY